ncbi:MAG: hypothetical protein KGI08_11485 [Thaumarchaeota archaeon]|nr:hypothetical protein [Nitrososphaerota archaeon]
MLLPSWRPKKRSVYYAEKPDWIDDWVYTEAVTAKRFYNENWEFWVWQESLNSNVSQAIAEDACIRGLRKALSRVKFVYGDKVGEWYEQYLEMGDIFSKVKHPNYVAKLEGVK